MDVTAARPIPKKRTKLSDAAQHRLLIAGLVAGDVFALGAGFFLAHWLRFRLQPYLFQTGDPSTERYLPVFAILLPTMLVLFAMLHLYDEDYLFGGTREYAFLFQACTWGVMAVITYSFLTPTFVIARGWLILAWGCCFTATAVGRWFFRRAVYGLRNRGYLLSPAIVVGDNEEAHALAEQLYNWPTSGLRLIGFVDDIARPNREVMNGLRVLGRVVDLERLVAEHSIGEVIVATTALTRPALLEVFRAFGNSPQVRLRMSSGLIEIMTTGVTVREVGFVPLLSVNKVRLTGLDVALKTLLDYAVTLPSMVFLLPVFAAIALAVKFDSPGPVFHRRCVLGCGGRAFDAFKFRTMHVGGDALLTAEKRCELDANGKLKCDPRITRVGAILRKLSLDELPQLLNVLLLQMSLVGPRMIAPTELSKYGQWSMNLLTIRPGLTGLWQVSGRSDIGYEERVRLDMTYIRNYSIWLDLQILFRTIPAVLNGRGAY